MKRAAALIVAAVNALFAFAAGAIFPSPAMLVCLPISAALTASLIFTYRSPAAFAAPVLSAVTVLMLTRDAACAAVPLLSVLPSLVLAVMFYTRASRAFAVFVGAFAFTFVLAAASGALYLSAPEEILSIDEIKVSLTEAISSVAVNTRDGRVPLYTAEAAAELAAYFIMSLPAAAIIVVCSVSFVCTEVFLLLMRLFGFSECIPNGNWTYSPSLVTSVVYLASYAVSASLIPFPDADVIGFAAENVLIALIPAMLFTGERALYLYSKKREGLIVFTILSVVLLMLSPSLYLMIITFSGAFSVILSRVRPHIERFLHRDGDDE